MILSIRKYLTTSYISVAFSDNVYFINTRVIRNNKIVKNTTKEFDNLNRLLKYINEVIKVSYFYYFGIFFESVGQGAISDMNPETLEKFHINKNDIISLKLDTFYVYANNQEINKVIALFEEQNIDVDFILSPFAILYKQISPLNVFNSNKIVFYILKYTNYVTLMIIKNKKLLYATFFYTRKQNDITGISGSGDDYIKSGVEDIIEQKEEDEDLFKESDMVFENIENMDKLENIEDLSLDNIEDTIEEEKEDLKTFAVDMDLFDCMKTALNDYYSSDMYDSDFIEDIVLFSDQRISKSVVSLIENDLLIKPHIYDINVLEQMINIMKESL